MRANIRTLRAVCLAVACVFALCGLAQGGPDCQANTPAAQAAYEELRAFLLLHGYPERLVRQIDIIPRCLHCMQSARGFVIEAVYEGSDQIKTQGWSRMEEARHLGYVASGAIKRFRIRYQGDDCFCCDRPAHSSALWIDKTSLYPPPPDLTEIPPPDKPTPGPHVRYPPPLGQAHASCSACAADANARNDAAATLRDLRVRLVDAFNAEEIADADSKRWEEWAGYLRTLPRGLGNDATLAAALAKAHDGQQRADLQSSRFAAEAKATRPKIEAAERALDAADHALARCEATQCVPRASASEPPAKPEPLPTIVAKSKATGLGGTVLDQLNLARTRPGEFAKTLRGDGEAAAFLRAQMPIGPLTWNAGLAAAAARHAADAGSNGLTAHIGTDGSTMGQRIKAEGIVAGVTAEGLSLGHATAAGVVGQLIIDAGLPTHPHRGDIFDPSLIQVGVGCGPHKVYHYMCVIDYAGAVMAGGPLPPPPPQVAKADCWIDAATGHPVSTGPPGWSPSGSGGQPGENPDANHVAHGGHTFVRLPDGSWIDAATGHPVSTGPPGWSPTGSGGQPGENPDANHVAHGGHTFVRVLCP